MTKAPTGIDTLRRRLYLNSYVYLLIMATVGVAVIPTCLWGARWWLIALQAMVAYFCLYGAMSILRSWPDKKRKYAILMEKNRDCLHPDTFRIFMEAPCGRLLAKVVLRDLGYPRGTYRRVKREAKPQFWRNCRSTFVPSTERVVLHQIDQHNHRNRH